MVPTVMESHGILASHGKSWKMERVMEKSWNFNHLFFGKKFMSCKNKQDRWKISRMAKKQPKCAIFRQKISKIFWAGGTAPSPDPTPTGEGNTPDQTAHPRYIFVHLLFGFFGHCTYKSNHGKACLLYTSPSPRD